MAIDLYPHQAKALGKIKNGSILRGGVGSGKSITALAYYVARVAKAPIQINGVGIDGPMQNPIDLYIITTAKKRNDLEWWEELARFAISSDPDVSYHKVQVTVDSWQNVKKYIGVVDAFFIFDEAKAGGNGVWSKSFVKISRNNQWILLSATPGDVWIDYASVFVANGFYKNVTEFMRQHVVITNYGSYPKIDRYVDTHRLERLRDSIEIPMKFTRHTTRVEQNIIVSYNKTKFDQVWKDRWHIFEQRPIRDASEMFLVARKLVNTDVARMAGVMELSEIHPKLIIFYNFNDELDILRQLKNILDIEVAEYNGSRHDPVPTGNRWLYLVQYTAGSEAWNCITTDAMVFFSLNYSYRVMEQCRGRIDRINTPYSILNYYILRSDSIIDNAIIQSLKKKEIFNEKELIKTL